MKRTISLFGILFFLVFTTNAQQFPPDFPEGIKIETDTVPKGVLKKNFAYLYTGLGFIVGQMEDPGSKILYGTSTNFSMGIRYFHRVSNVYRLGFDIGHDGYSYNLKQDSAKFFPTTQLHKKERLVLNNLNVTLVNRIRIANDKKSMGTFIDVGFYAGWTHTSYIYTEKKHPVANAAGASRTQEYHRGLVYTHPYRYGAMLGFGRNIFRFVGKYQLSDIFKPGIIYPEMPRFSIGIEIGMHP